MGWVEGFYSQTGQWWGPAESSIDAIDRWRASLVLELVGSPAAESDVLELGCDDEDQRRLLRRISGEWLGPGGVAVLEVYNPFWWSAQAGFEETKLARPEEGYHFDLGHRRDFDTSSCRALDSWWEVNSPTVIWTQSLRCYSPADLSLLLEESGLRVERLRSADPANDSAVLGGDGGPSYLALLVHE